MNFIYVIHLMCWNYLILLITQNRHRNNRSNSRDWDNKGGARASRAPPFVVAVNAVVSVVLFDQNLDQKIDLGWPGLAWVKPWAGPASPGLGPGQVLGKLAHLSFFSPGCFKKVHF